MSTANVSKPGEGKEPSYDRKQVDRIVDQCLTKAAGELGVEEVSEDDAKKLVDLNSQTVANVIFTQRKGKRGYDERQVDYYLNECVQLLTRLESYARVADFVGRALRKRDGRSQSARNQSGIPRDAGGLAVIRRSSRFRRTYCAARSGSKQH